MSSNILNELIAGVNMEAYQVERALINAIEMKRDFSHCAEWINGIISKLSTVQKEKEQLLADLVDFFNHYRVGGTY